ncbi:uncharacterized protein EV154DRAFT_488096 [Mucor mucedo]|uniref:uncharacterized protein n=1 Tax=Mucor mucedo TaxID=29922 RepID=UPI00221F1D4A|nr:uncharacterized protein EV154DRAFT_488096 [Mucor mucedo]KAI7868684.1 hypothetical protein EV154DRAFT_488096 [Mucor mucedo]
MQRNFSNFPVEILDVIFGYVRGVYEVDGLKQCELVCKKWMLPAQRCLYSEVLLPNINSAKAIIVALTDDDTSSPGRFTQTLAYLGKYDIPHITAAAGIKSFIDIFPNLRHVYCQNDEVDYYSALIKAHGEGKLKDLNSIGTCPEQFIDKHDTCAMLHKNTLQILNVREGYRNFAKTSLYDQLHLFPKMRKLTLETNKHNFYQYSEHINGNMRDLKAVYYENIENADYNGLAPYETVDISKIIPRPGVKELVIEGFCYEDDNLLLYLMTKYPALNAIRINLKRDCVIRQPNLYKKIKSTHNNFSVPMLSKFMAFVVNCKYFTMDLLYTTLNVDEILKGFWDLRDLKETKLVGLTYAEGTNWQDPEEQRSVNGKALVNIALEVDQSIDKKAVMFNYASVGADLPHLRVVEKVGKNIDHLIVCLGPDKCLNVIYGQDVETITLVNGGFLGHILQHCTNLQKLQVYFSRILFYNSDEYPTINTCITELCLERVVVAENVLTEISKQLPSLKKLQLKDVHHVDEEDEDVIDYFNSEINMPQTSFRFLYVKNYIIDGAYYSHYPSKILIKLTTNNEDTYYKYESPVKIDIEESALDSDSDEEDADEVEQEKNPDFPLAAQIKEGDFNSGLGDHTFANIHITCKSVNYLVVSLKKISPALSCCVLLPDKSGNLAASMSEKKLREHYLQGDR